MNSNKICIISDTHFGVKKGNETILQHQISFFKDQFFPYCIKNGITDIIHMGDFFDQRKFLSYKIMNTVENEFISILKENNLTLHITLGNHDILYKDTNKINSVDLVLRKYGDCIKIYDEPTEKTFGDCNIAFLPWVNPENEKESLAFIEQCTAPILFAHLDIIGFDMIKGGLAQCTHGFNREIFQKFEAVYTGHYHTKSEQNNIHYLGTQYEMTWADSDDPKYFHVFDTITRELEAIRNPHTLFNKFYYDGDATDIPDESKVKNCYCRVIVLNKEDLHRFDTWVDKIQEMQPEDLNISENLSEYLGENISDDVIVQTDTPSLLTSYINAIETNLDKNILNKLVIDIYTEAHSIS